MTTLHETNEALYIVHTTAEGQIRIFQNVGIDAADTFVSDASDLEDTGRENHTWKEIPSLPQGTTCAALFDQDTITVQRTMTSFAFSYIYGA